MPFDLQEGISAVVLPESDNAYYTGPAFGTVDELRAAVNDRQGTPLYNYCP